MKYENIKKLSPYDTGMLANILTMTEVDTRMVMLDKGDVECHVAPAHVQKGFDMPKGKSMKAAERRKKTFHKREQREKKYRDLGYPIERFSASERGKMREGVGMFPESQHSYSMYNRNGCKGGMRGYRKESKSITTKQAIDMMAHDEWLDEQEAERRMIECEMMDLYEAIGYYDDKCERKTTRLIELKREVENAEGYLNWLLEQVEDVNNSIKDARNAKNRLLDSLEEIQRKLSK